ncbi:hypothetical protein TPEGhana051_0548a [Treponema pallidum subsp. pertenue]|uniref:Uncharacterized protein n=2 Tax=Treponema pallidum TaxID=160 RepID=A0AAU8RMF4_TREPL|nr:hypothetical protein TPESAMD_0548a [Treponema pallidum subsp. pertenue str. SamoaD]AEZ58744.1 hypothetical protein TPECDC2_0548a [Treponema pallidum subsp. pertenue str. CDC2]AEZ59812.1 hypothetical protein TPEGAU_0548a [Treponema pallidum subsp. pertenue str. Gauthier]AGK84196.1 hypothetical protein TPFB_0548a [Treponema pallidum str. Fribourg-Blanc]AJB40572.1 hypothetical protein TENDBA_0548a [Treponema pallidum subsp. endemicum str. Bosnia A]ASV58203.1 hypothetical protein TPEGhana051_05
MIFSTSLPWRTPALLHAALQRAQERFSPCGSGNTRALYVPRTHALHSPPPPQGGPRVTGPIRKCP